MNFMNINKTIMNKKIKIYKFYLLNVFKYNYYMNWFSGLFGKSIILLVKLSLWSLNYTQFSLNLIFYFIINPKNQRFIHETHFNFIYIYSFLFPLHREFSWSFLPHLHFLFINLSIFLKIQDIVKAIQYD